MPENEVLRLSTLTTLTIAMREAVAHTLAASNITQWSDEIDTEPATTGTDGTYGGYFTSEGLLQRLREENGAWVEDGDPVITERYFTQSAIFDGILGVYTQADLFAITDLPDGTLRRVTQDADPDKRGIYQADAADPNSWVKELTAFASVLDPEDESKGVNGKAVADWIPEVDRVKGWVSNILDGYGVDIPNLVYSDAGNIESGNFTWPDGKSGTFSDLDENSAGELVSIRLNRPSGKYVTVFSNGNLIATGY